ncbi:MAG: hypothetical protein RJB26_1324 [Pseudomonadota bacterium]|jgi:hypothetical protein
MSEDIPPEFNDITAPAHYIEGRKYEPFNVMMDWFPNDPLLFNAMKYMSRAGRKGDKSKDLQKCLFFLAKAIEREEEAKK